MTGRYLSPLECSETLSEYMVMLSITGIDLRRIFVMASPQGLLIEVRDRETVNYGGNGPVFSEIRDLRVSRELRFHYPIEKGISLRVNGNQLRMTCRKASTGEEQPWSELLRFDTRASFGCV